MKFNIDFTSFTRVQNTVMARLNTRALMNFEALLPPVLIQNRRLFETQPVFRA